MVLSIYTGAGGWFFQYKREREVGSFDIHGNRRLLFRYIRDTEVGPFNIYGRRVDGSFNIYGSRKLGLSIYTVAGGWFFQYIR